MALRQSQDPRELEEKSRVIMECLERDPRYGEAELVLFYASFGWEVSTHAAIRQALASGKRVALPTVDGSRLRLAEVRNFDKDLIPNSWGILEPRLDRAAGLRPRDFPLAIVPGVAFDLENYRLGYGKGYYDRLLSQMPQAYKIGVAYELQVVCRLPRSARDVGVDCVITEVRKLTNLT